MNELRLGLDDGIQYLKKHGINQVTIELKFALAPNSLQVRYIASLILLTNKKYNIPDEIVLIPYDDKWAPLIDMYFLDGLPLTSDGSPAYHLVEAHEPFEEKHMEGRYKGTALERCTVFLQIIKALEKNNIAFIYAAWGGAKEIKEWVNKTLEQHDVAYDELNVRFAKMCVGSGMLVSSILFKLLGEKNENDTDLQDIVNGDMCNICSATTVMFQYFYISNFGTKAYELRGESIISYSSQIIFKYMYVDDFNDSEALISVRNWLINTSSKMDKHFNRLLNGLKELNNFSDEDLKSCSIDIVTEFYHSLVVSICKRYGIDDSVSIIEQALTDNFFKSDVINYLIKPEDISEYYSND